MPTLLEPGNIVEQKWMGHSAKERIKTILPITYVMEFLEERISTSAMEAPKIKPTGIGSRVIVLKSGTGSGKSTTLPPFLYNTFFERLRKNIAVTQPRVLTAVDIPYQIIQYNKNIKVGENIGYQTGPISKKITKGIVFMTVGTLLQQLKIMTDEEIIKKYSFIIIDEVHERYIDVDSCLFYMKRFYARNWDKNVCPILILMSATFNPAVFMDYFSCPKEHFIEISGSTYPIERHYAKRDISDYVSYAATLAEKIHVDNIKDILDNQKFRDVLIFVQGNAQMVGIADKLHYLNTMVFSKDYAYMQEHSAAEWEKYGGAESYYIAPIALNSENFAKGGKDYKDLFSDIGTVQVPIYNFTDSKDGPVRGEVLRYVRAGRRIIVGTNVAETGVTIDTLKYCIDTGWVNSSEFNPNFGCSLLVAKNVTRAASEQRRGRVGRKAPGIWYSCYTEETMNNMPAMQAPDIVSSDVSQSLLSIIIGETESEIVEVDFNKRDSLCFQKNQFDQRWYKLECQNHFDASKLDFIQYPSADSIGYGIEKLYGLGFIDHEYKPTILGMYGSRFRKLRLENIRMILGGYQYGANILDLITIAACIEIGFQIGINRRKYVPRNPLRVSDQQAFYYYKILFYDEFIEYLFLWYDFMEAIDSMGRMLEKNITIGKSKVLPMNYLPDWCIKNNVKFEGLLKVIEIRDEIIADMLTIGVNPYYNGLDIPKGSYHLGNILRRNLSEGIEEIRKIKQSIYEGYRFNLCIWNGKSYVCQYSHVEVAIDSKLIKQLKGDDLLQNNPQKIIVSNIMMRDSMANPGMYEFVGGEISVLDGYVDVDVNFLYH